ncbi:G-type lectin S-receptor-like serine/threonine-protein kinase SD2-5 [Iris pallida]|uniref:Receptor-like serine/threonine-protein kinase n=1 Tax=Iris pallida TaxID=29817 RepID=A0AAX6EVH3_IRIPA|nr:G-type lectin S-receptor-like serine/threonine-protein kinase SD2-5 [Iris pallida]
MENRDYGPSIVAVLLLCTSLIISPVPSNCSIQSTQISPGFQGSQMSFIDNNGLFLVSNSSAFAFGFITSSDPTSFFLGVLHQPSSTTVWTANGASPVTHSDDFVFGKDGNAHLQSAGSAIWSTNTSGKGAAVMELLDNGNLVVLAAGGGGGDGSILWQSFGFPTDTLLSGQSFVDGMALLSKPNSDNISYQLRIGDGDMRLYAGFRPPQPYWSMQQENRKIDNKMGGKLYSATFNSTSWSFFDRARSLLWQFVAAGDSSDSNAVWAVVLGSDGFLSFYSLPNGSPMVASSTKIPQDPCGLPLFCGPYYVCDGGRCVCPPALNSLPNCNPGVPASACSSSAGTPFELAKVGDGVGYFANALLPPSLAKSSLRGCQDACRGNCSCLGLFFDGKSGNCFLYDQIGSFMQLDGKSSAYSSYIKVSSTGTRQDGNGSGGGGSNKHIAIVLIICFVTAAVIAAIIYLAVRLRRRSNRLPEPSHLGSSEGEDFWDNISGMPVRFVFRELQEATDNFSVKLGQGGFGSVYLGKLPNGSQIAVKQLEGIGQGKKEFRAEVSTIGSIHHVHLVRLKGFCAEGAHRLLAYEYMPKGSLERWIFPNSKGGHQLDWNQRFNIALGTAKGLAYLHEDCDVKIVHCDIKPENVLLDDNFVAKVSDFGLAKLMTREQSHVFTTMRGTRGYLAPEWITSYAISEKSDVYSFGMVLLEIIGGRKNFDPSETSEKAHFPSYAFKKMEEGKLKEIFDSRLALSDKDDRVETAIKVALWCIQEDLSSRPSMSKVVQMLEGVCYVPQPPMSPQIGFRLYANLLKSISDEGSSSTSGPSDSNSDALLSAVRLSGPR